MSTSRPRIVGEVLSQYLHRQKLSTRLHEATVINDWEELVGTQVASVTEPQSVDRDATLWVRVLSASWLQELQLMSPTILKELANRGRFVKRIRWTLGASEPSPAGGSTTKRRRR